MAGEPQSQDQKNRTRHKPHGLRRPKIVRVFRTLLREIDRYRASKQKEKSDHEINERMMAHWTRRVGWFTFALVVITAVSASIFKWQLDAMQGQLAVMQADERPWIRVEITPGDIITNGPGGSGSPFPTLIFSPNLKMTNVGKSPAFNAQLFLSGHAITKDHADPYAGQKESCERLRNMPLDNSARGRLLFPNDYFTGEIELGQYNVAFMGAAAAHFFTKEKDGSFSIIFYVIGCADYVFGSPPSHHQTGFVYDVWNVSNLQATRTFNTFHPVKGDNIRLTPSPSSSLAD